MHLNYISRILSCNLVFFPSPYLPRPPTVIEVSFSIEKIGLSAIVGLVKQPSLTTIKYIIDAYIFFSIINPYWIAHLKKTKPFIDVLWKYVDPIRLNIFLVTSKGFYYRLRYLLPFCFLKFPACSHLFRYKNIRLTCFNSWCVNVRFPTGSFHLIDSRYDVHYIFIIDIPGTLRLFMKSKYLLIEMYNMAESDSMFHQNVHLLHRFLLHFKGNFAY